MNCHCSKEKLIELYNNSEIYKSLIRLSNFKYDDLLNIPDIMDKVNIFTSYFKGNDCNNMNDVKIFFQNWQIYFKNKSIEYEKEAYNVLDDLWNVINEKIWLKKNKKIRNIKSILLDIHNKYILPR